MERIHYPTKDLTPHLHDVQLWSGLDKEIRLYDPTTDSEYMPRDYGDQRITRAIIAYGQRILCREVIEVSPDLLDQPAISDTAALRAQIENDLTIRTRIVGSLVAEALLHVPSPSVALIPPRPKSIESATIKLGRRFGEQNTKPISDYSATTVVVDDELGQSHAYDVLAYLRDCFHVPKDDEYGEPTVSSLGNSKSVEGFEGLQAKLRVVLGDEVFLFEVQAYTQSQYIKYRQNHSQYEAQRAVSGIDNFIKLIQAERYTGNTS